METNPGPISGEGKLWLCSLVPRRGLGTRLMVVNMGVSKATPSETIVSRPDFCDFTCGRAAYYH